MSYFISIDALQNVGSYNLGTMFQSYALDSTSNAYRFIAYFQN